MHQPVIEKKNLEQEKQPPLYTVVIHNDDFTPMDFVVELIVHVFGKTPEQAEQLTWAIHTADRITVGAFSKEVAETKSLQSNQLAQENQHPLLTDIEKLN